MKTLPGELVGSRWFGDHWQYAREDFRQLIDEARSCSANAIVTTEKDWVKIAVLIDKPLEIPIWRIELALKFEDDDEQKLFESIHSAISEPAR